MLHRRGTGKGLPAPRGASLHPLRHCHQHNQGSCLVAAKSRPSRVQAGSETCYTPVDTSGSFAVFSPPVIDISNVLAGHVPAPQQLQQVQEVCAATGFLAITGHGISEQQLRQLFASARRLFDSPLEVKMQLVVGGMKAGRGYEISPEHTAYMQAFQQAYHGQSSRSSSSSTQCTEPSALQGILSERFCCGPELTPQQQHDPYYSSDLGQVFFPPNAWPSRVPELQPQLLQCYSQCEAVAAAIMQLFAAALGVEPSHFDQVLTRHHSNIQVANYPSQLLDPGPSCLRKKAHIDSGCLTLLAAEDWLTGSGWVAGDGGLQLLNTQQEWLEVTVPPGALLVNLGSLMTRWTNTLWNSTLHRVTNPPPHKQHNSRRMSLAFFHKPAYDALVEVLPTCYSGGSADSSGSTAASRRLQLPPGPLFPPAVVGDLTRQGILHRYRHLPPAEASHLYHAALAELHNAGQVQQQLGKP